ncbi:hypothetical protein [uncultured Bartonella sp.]|uniref:hypothetical protein n=1 Tax=uncultured Bartonella sp. TaxID=104108 RepID=UPI002639CAA2|nr:hypothetical protein [uncultured Bartonella sp.]
MAALLPTQAMHVISFAASIHATPLLPYGTGAFNGFFASSPAKAVFAQSQV